jgi:hypothetical protein
MSWDQNQYEEVRKPSGTVRFSFLLVFIQFDCLISNVVAVLLQKKIPICIFCIGNDAFFVIFVFPKLNISDPVQLFQRFFI